MEREEFEIGGVKYRAANLTAIKQLHVARRLAPVLSSFKEIIEAAEGGDIYGALTPLVDAISKMSDQDVEYVVNTCLAVVEREEPNGTGWSKLWSERAQRPTRDDLDMLSMVRIAAYVVQENLRPFLQGLGT